MSDAMHIDDIHNALLAAAVEIGAVIDMAHWASAGLAARIFATGRNLEDLTVGQLIAIIKQQERDHAQLENRVTAVRELEAAS